MKLSMMSYTMSHRAERFGVAEVREMFELSRELGLDGIDFVRIYDIDPRELRRMADDYGVPVVCHTFFADLSPDSEQGRRAGIDVAKRGIENAVLLNTRTVMIPPVGRTEMPREICARNVIAALQEVVPFAADAGVTVTIENFPERISPFVTSAEVLRAVDAVPGLKLTFDGGNCETGGEPAALSFERSAEHVVHAHFKDWTVRPAATRGYTEMLDGRFYKAALIGEGVIDHRRCLAAMRAAGYGGHVNIEYTGDEYAPAEAMRRAVAYLRQTWGSLS